MYQGTTPTLKLVVTEDITQCTVYITFRDVKYGTVYTWTNHDPEFLGMHLDNDERETEIRLRLTQAETLALSRGCIEIQVRFIDAEGIANATDIGRVENLEALYKQEIKYAEG